MPYFNVEDAKKLTAAEVRHCVSDWEDRITDLFREVESWAQASGRLAEARWGRRQQRNEWLLQLTHVAPRELPTLDLDIHAGHRIWAVSLLPSARWVVGANGRIDLFVGESHYLLVDMEGRNGQPSRWMIVTPDARRNMIRFTRPVLFGLLNR